MSHKSQSEVWDHILAGRFAEAEGIVRAFIGGADTNDHERLCHLFGLLGSVLNSLGRHDDATNAIREALNHELQAGGSDREPASHRYILASQHLTLGDPKQALAVIQIVPPGVGHVHCLLHTTAAKALWILGRQNDARRAAAEALAAAPTEERHSDVLSELQEIWESRS